MHDESIIVIDDTTNKELAYDHIYLHNTPEEELLSLYVGGFGDMYRTIYRIMGNRNESIRSHIIRVRKF